MYVKRSNKGFPEAAVQRIRERLLAGESVRGLSMEYGRNPETIRRLARGETYKRVQLPEMSVSSLEAIPTDAGDEDAIRASEKRFLERLQAEGLLPPKGEEQA